MLKLNPLALILAGILAGATASAQETPTNTRRPTPSSTSTRTHTVAVSTPTPPQGGSDVFLCSGGFNDGSACDNDENCPGGACVLPQGVCDNGDRNGEYCDTTSECTGGGTCSLAHKVCLAGDAKGNSCLRDEHCPESACISTGLFCDGGDFDLYSCVDDSSCVGEFEAGVCVSPSVFLCSGGANADAECRSDLDCPAGACVLAQGVCVGGEADNSTCEGDVHCPGGTCQTTARVCDAGSNKSIGCITSADCPSGSCASTGKVCSGGDFDSIACVDASSCTPAAGEAGECITPGPNFYCSGGAADSFLCATDDDCPDGGCVFSQGVCDGGTGDGDFCETSADCAGSVPCIQTQRVCLAGDLAGFSCFDNRQCDSGVLCGSSGLFCSGGAFDRYSCVNDENCCDDDGCDENGEDEDDGVCRSADVLRCSGGTAANQACGSHFDCPGGACVLAQKVCDGGEDDGFGCEGAVNCASGADCVATALVCSGGDDDSFGCLRSSNCRGGGSCLATGQACDGGDTASSDYDPFEILFSCTNNASCFDETLSCRAPTAVGFACSAGSRDGQACESDMECPQGVCVLQDTLCENGSRDAQLCDTGADCPGGACRATQRVCESSGLSCVNASQCETSESEACLSSGRVCSGSSFGAFSCADDVNCYDASDPNVEQGACVGLTPRACSLEAPCTLAPSGAGEVFGLSVNPLTSPATFDFFVVPIAANAAGAVVVLRPSGSDADLYLGRNPTSAVFSPTDYPFASNNSEQSTDFVRVSPQSTPTFADFTSGLVEYAAAVVGIGGETSYLIEALTLGASEAGDADCDGDVDQADLDGMITVPYDPATRLTAGSSTFARCLGGDANADGAETVADLIGAIRARAQP